MNEATTKVVDIKCLGCRRIFGKVEIHGIGEHNEPVWGECDDCKELYSKFPETVELADDHKLVLDRKIKYYYVNGMPIAEYMLSKEEAE